MDCILGSSARISDEQQSSEVELLGRYFSNFLSEVGVQEYLFQCIELVSASAANDYKAFMRQHGFEIINAGQSLRGVWNHSVNLLGQHTPQGDSGVKDGEIQRAQYPAAAKVVAKTCLVQELERLESDLDKVLSEKAHCLLSPPKESASVCVPAVKKTDSGLELVSNDFSQQRTVPTLRSIGRWSDKKAAEFQEQTLRAALAIFKHGQPEPSSLSAEDMVHICLVCGLPRYMSLALTKACLLRQEEPSNLQDGAYASVNYSSFLQVWTKVTNAYRDPDDICFGILAECASKRGRLVFESFEPLLEEVLLSHPGLDFLQGLAVFKKLYMETVITRFFYEKANSATNELSLAEWRKGKYCTILRRLEQNGDINAARDVFSYKHFYVIYCKFWELDEDHDMQIERRSVHLYDGGSMLETVSQRAASGFGRQLWSTDPQKWSYRDFIWFILSTEEKSHPSAIEYWFRCCDLDGDGVLSLFELSEIFEEQLDRMFDQSLRNDYMKREDFLCILLDMCRPLNDSFITMSDLKKCRHTEHFFNFLFDMRQYENLTTRRHDPLFREWYDIVVPGTDGAFVKLEGWDRFAERAYDELASIDVNSQSNNSGVSQSSMVVGDDAMKVETDSAPCGTYDEEPRDSTRTRTFRRALSRSDSEDDSQESSMSSMEEDEPYANGAVTTAADSPPTPRRRLSSISPSDERRRGITILDDLITTNSGHLDPGALSRSIATFIEGSSSLINDGNRLSSSPRSSPIMSSGNEHPADESEPPASLNLSQSPTSGWLPQLCTSINTNGMVFGRSTSPSPPRYFRPKSLSPKRNMSNASGPNDDLEAASVSPLNLEPPRSVDMDVEP